MNKNEQAAALGCLGAIEANLLNAKPAVRNEG
jgi:hypothetical protein